MDNFNKRLKRLREIKKNFKPHVSISFLEGADILNMLSKTPEKKIISIRGSKKYDPHIAGIQGFVRKKLLIPTLYRRADQIVTASNGLYIELAEDYPALSRKLLTIPNGYYFPEVKPKLFKTHYFIIGWAGRFGDEKGLLEFVEVFKLSHDADTSLRLLLIGNGPLQKAIENYFIKNNKRVISCTSIDQSLFEGFDVIICEAGNNYEQVLGLSDSFVLTSPSEGFPNVLIEAMQLQIPVVSTDCKWGPREILEPSIKYQEQLVYPHFGEYGVLLPVLDKTSISIKIWQETLLNLKNDKERLERYKSKSVEGSLLYDQANVKSRWYKLIKQML